MISKTLILTALLGGVALAMPAAAQTVVAPAPMVVSPNAGAFNKLSTGEQKIAQSLFDAQTIRSAGPLPMTRDDIAVARSGTGWGQVFQQMQAQNLVQARNLGEVVSGHYTPPRSVIAVAPATGARPAAATTANGKASAAGGSASAKGNSSAAASAADRSATNGNNGHGGGNANAGGGNSGGGHGGGGNDSGGGGGGHGK